MLDLGVNDAGIVTQSAIFVQRLVTWDSEAFQSPTTAQTQTLCAIHSRGVSFIVKLDMKIKKRLLTTLIVVSILLTLTFVYAHVNSMVSYKYEVEDSLNSGRPLKKHQIEIIADVRNTKIAYIAFGPIFILTLSFRLGTPNFGGRITYIS